MNELSKYMPLDKSWIIRMGFLDLINGYDDITKFLDKEKDSGDDMIALKRVVRDWNTNKPLYPGESATIYRFGRRASHTLGLNKKFILRGTLIERAKKFPRIKDIANKSIRELLDLGTSQEASAAVLMGNKEQVDNPPYKLQLSYDAVSHWDDRREKGLCWIERYDKTIEKQALAYINLLKTGKMDFTPEHSEDYCFARIFNLITPEQGEKKFPSLIGHETNRIREMERIIDLINKDAVVDTPDHRVAQAHAMNQLVRGKDIKLKDRSVVNKSWPLFFDFIDYCKRKYL